MKKNKQHPNLRMMGMLVFLCCSFIFLPSAASAKGNANPHTEIRLQEVSLETGVTLEYAEKGHGKGQVIIFLHGYTDSWYSYSRVLELLPPRFHGYALSQRGHGDSDKPVSGYSMQNFADDVIAFMDHFGIHRAVIVGHSMSSVIAQRIAIDYPERIKKLVMIGPIANPDSSAMLLDFLAYVNTLEDPIDPAFVIDFQVSTLYNPVPQEFLETVVNESLKVPILVWQQALAGMTAVNHLGELPSITTPTFIFWGDKDSVFPYEDQLPIIQAMPDAMFMVYPDTGHGLHWEKPEQFVQDLESIL
jgi:pimeloyl-ACP methyl ester carboxylesterase